MVALAAAYRQQVNQPDQEEPRQLRDVWAQAGTLDNADGPAANDLEAALQALLIYHWIFAIYRANSAVSAHFCAKRGQNKIGQFCGTDTAQSLAITGFPEKMAKFWAPSTLCQMNSPLTHGGIHRHMKTKKPLRKVV